MMDYHELIDALTDEGNPNVLDYINDAVETLEHLYSELRAANTRCEMLSKILTEYQDELIPGYRERAEKAERKRDAAVSDIETMLAYGGTNFDACLFCKNRYCYARNGTKPCYPEWRGPQEE